MTLPRRVIRDVADLLAGRESFIALIQQAGGVHTIVVVSEQELRAFVAKVAGVAVDSVPVLPKAPDRCAWAAVLPGSRGRVADMMPIDVGRRPVEL